MYYDVLMISAKHLHIINNVLKGMASAFVKSSFANELLRPTRKATREEKKNLKIKICSLCTKPNTMANLGRMTVQKKD